MIFHLKNIAIEIYSKSLKLWVWSEDRLTISHVCRNIGLGTLVSSSKNCRLFELDCHKSLSKDD